MSKTPKDQKFTPDQEACIDTLASVFGGHHHLPRVYSWGSGVCVNFGGDLSTYDDNKLTRLVIAAHRDAVRIEIGWSGRGMVRVIAHRREHGNRNTIPFYRYHPNLNDLALEALNTKGA